jgi:hypothetical protein
MTTAPNSPIRLSADIRFFLGVIAALILLGSLYVLIHA